MTMQTTICIQCKTQFTIDDRDQAFYEKVKVPAPKRCAKCRQQVRLAWTNELNLYQRKCDLTGVSMLSMYPPTVPFPVYKSSEWHNSDKWDARKYGRDIDFSRPFFEQWKELRDQVPHYSRLVIESTLQNSDYINMCSAAKNCYLIFDSDRNENCYYSYTIQDNRDVVDCAKVRESELSYECKDCLKLYNCRYCQNTQNSTDSAFLYNCTDCTDCFGCVNMKSAKYAWFNEKLSKEEYEKRRAAVDLGNREQVKQWAEKFEAHKKKFPKLYFQGVSNVDCTGDYLINSKNALDSYDGFRLEDSRYCYSTFLPMKDAYDTYEFGEDTSLIYNSVLGGFKSYQIKFSWGTFEGCTDLEYCQHCKSSESCFGCVGLNKGKYCILNKEYSKEEYERLKAKLIAHMKETGEYGEYFPPAMSPFGYNKTNAQVDMPLSKEEAVKLGFNWAEEEKSWKPSTYVIPANIKDVPDSIVNEVLADKDTGQNYKIIEPELAFYEKMGIPVPENCFMERHLVRMRSRNPKQLWDRPCDKCKKPLSTTFDPAKGDTVYCRECFLEVVV